MKRAVALWAVLSMLLSGPGAAAQAAPPPPSAAAPRPSPAPAKRAPPKSLDELLERVKQAGSEQTEESRRREVEFVSNEGEQVRLLEEAEGEEKAELERSEALEKEFEDGEKRLVELQAELEKRLGTTGELFGVVRQVAGDTRAHVDGSVTSAQITGRSELLDRLAQSKELPKLEELEALWFTMHQELTESGKIVRFPATVVRASGESAERQVTRVGTFNVVADGKYLTWLPEVGQLQELERQPEERFLKTARAMSDATDGTVWFAVDPSRGSILSLLVQTPSLRERLEFGGVVGYVIIGLGAAALALALLRLAHLLVVALLVVRQRMNVGSPGKHNPLGRVIRVHQAHREADVETLERKLDEAILKETGRLERLLWAIKAVAVVAPLLGLLGTVTGMIRTFQTITLFGTGDPKLMAGGISEALVTTMLGLIAAIPLVLVHSILSSLSRRISEVLEVQSAGLVAGHGEEAPSSERRETASTETAAEAS